MQLRLFRVRYAYTLSPFLFAYRRAFPWFFFSLAARYTLLIASMFRFMYAVLLSPLPHSFSRCFSILYFGTKHVKRRKADPSHLREKNLTRSAYSISRCMYVVVPPAACYFFLCFFHSFLRFFFFPTGTVHTGRCTASLDDFPSLFLLA